MKLLYNNIIKQIGGIMKNTPCRVLILALILVMIAHALASCAPADIPEETSDNIETTEQVLETEPETVEVVEDAAAAAPQTFDAGIVAAVAAIVSAAGYAISKKH